MKVLIVPDKFKGTLTAQAAAEAIARGWKSARPDDSLDLLPMSDGGDGFGQVMAKLLNAQAQITRTVDAAHRPLSANWWWIAKNKTAVIDSAQVIGLALLPPAKFHPFELDTFGLGKIFQTAIKHGAKKILIGIGGSATNDGGFGLAHALGWRFLDVHGNEIKRWSSLAALETICEPTAKIFPKVVVAVDVQNPLLGKSGATRIYGGQKGLKLSEFAKAEQLLGMLARAARFGVPASAGPSRLKAGHQTFPGDGAAGGLGFGLRLFLNGTLERGFEIFSQHADLPNRIRKSDLVIAGEGAIDGQTFMGKGVGEIFKLCSQYCVRCLGLAGMTSKRAGKFEVHALTELTTVENARRDAAHWLERLAAKQALAFTADSQAKA